MFSYTLEFLITVFRLENMQLIRFQSIRSQNFCPEATNICHTSQLLPNTFEGFFAALPPFPHNLTFNEQVSHSFTLFGFVVAFGFVAVVVVAVRFIVAALFSC